MSVSPIATRILFLTVAHPATRRLSAWLQDVLGAAHLPLSSATVTDPDTAPPPGDGVFYLRPDAADVVALVAALDPVDSPNLRSACSQLAAMDVHWRHLPRLSLEAMLATPHAAVARIFEQDGRSADAHVTTAIDASIADLRRDMAIYRHPLAFLGAIGPGADVVTWQDHGLATHANFLARMLSASAPRRVLIATGDDPPAPGDLLTDPAEWSLREAPIDHLASCLEEQAMPWGVIHFHHVEDAALLETMLDTAMACLAPCGLLSGWERSDAAAQAVVARLTRGGDRHRLIFRLVGPQWLAMTDGGWR